MAVIYFIVCFAGVMDVCFDEFRIQVHIVTFPGGTLHNAMTGSFGIKKGGRVEIALPAVLLH
jgi:hypothetical protein